ncbi:AAA family ATPase [Aneurinibacillus sp. BA2021]|nr:AAA family ATPase [Aneurinibacillus sp. BA2021]
MHKIQIKNFGPIDYFEESISELTILIGPQASGKSTISKLIFFFRSIRDDLLKYLLSDAELRDPLFEFPKLLRKKFVGYFGTTKHMNRFEINYEYGEKKSVQLYLVDGYVKVKFSNELKNGIRSIFQEVKKVKVETKHHQSSLATSWDITSWIAQQRTISEKTKNIIDTLFEDSKTAIFIPAGRSLLSTLSDQLQEIVPQSLDFLMKDFIERINLLKRNFSNSFEDIVKDRKKYSTEKIDFTVISLAIETINKIMKGKYFFSSEGEKIFFNDKEYVKLMYASSGQQEVVWILLLIFTVILERLEVFIVIEEPEAHLYPSAQVDMVALLAILLNSTNNNIVITTHSPYILSSFNIFLYAGKVGNLLEKKNEKKIDKRLWINKEKIRAFSVNRVDNGFKYANIMDEELELIKAEAIDEASQQINELYDYLIDVELSEPGVEVAEDDSSVDRL